MTTVIHNGPRIIVRTTRRPGPQKVLVVTFSPAIERGESKPIRGFGEDYIAKLGYDTLCFISSDNHWWHVQEAVQAVEAAARICAEYDEVVGYGVSMGAYGALLFSKQLRLTRIIAAVPQYSIDPSARPFETRWAHFAKRVELPSAELVEAINPKSEIYFLYDPLFQPDYAHMALLKPAGGRHIRASFANHSVTRLLNRLKVLSLVVEGVIAGTADPAKIQREIVRSRKTDPEFFLLVGERLAAKGKTRLIRAFPNLDFSGFKKPFDVERAARVFTKAGVPLKAAYALCEVKLRNGTTNNDERIKRMVLHYARGLKADDAQLDDENLLKRILPVLDDPTFTRRVSRILSRTGPMASS